MTKRGGLAVVLAGAYAVHACTPRDVSLGYNDEQGAGSAAGSGGGTVGTTGGTSGSSAACIPGTTPACYDGPAGTEGVGLCKGGTKMCNPDGMTFGLCAGEVTPQPENCATPQDESCKGPSPFCKGTPLWSKRFGDHYGQVSHGIATGNAGSVLVTGYVFGTVDFGGGPLVGGPKDKDVFVTKLDTSGGYRWARRFGDVGADQIGNAVALDAMGNVVVAGGFRGTVDFGGGPLISSGEEDAFLVRFDANGGHLWSKRFGDAATQTALSIVVDGAGNVLVTGYFLGTVDFGGGPLVSAGAEDVFVAKFDAAGKHLWSKRFGGPNTQLGTCVTADGTGNVLITGDFVGFLDLGGGQLTDGGGLNAFVVKLDASGAHLWSEGFGSADTLTSASIASDAAGDVVVVGSFLGSANFGGGPLTSVGTEDAFMVKLDAGGGHLWSKRFGEAGDQVANSVAVDIVGNIVVTGFSTGAIDLGGGPLASAGGQDAFVAKFSAGGAHVWSKRFGDASDQLGIAVATDAAANVLVTGAFAGVVDLGDGPLMSAGGPATSGEDIFVAKFAQ